MRDFLSENSVFIAIAAALFAMTTMIFAILNYFSRYQRSSKLYYYPRKANRIFYTLSDDLKGFELRYKGIPISSDIIQIDGKIICRGKDINSKNNQITITAPAGCKWIDISITKNGNIKASAEVSKEDEKKALLSFDKLRRNKSFIINAILQSSKDLSEMSVDSIHNKITFEHNIDDTDDVFSIENYLKFQRLSLLTLLLLSAILVVCSPILSIKIPIQYLFSFSAVIIILYFFLIYRLIRLSNGHD